MTCVGTESHYTTFEKLVYLGESLDTAQQIEHACNVFRSRFHNDNAIVQACAKGFIDHDDMITINESHCGIIKDFKELWQHIKVNEPHRMIWKEFVDEHLRLGV